LTYKSSFTNIVNSPTAFMKIIELARQALPVGKASRDEHSPGESRSKGA
jgi:hypothetical protein